MRSSSEFHEPDAANRATREAFDVKEASKSDGWLAWSLEEGLRVIAERSEISCCLRFAEENCNFLLEGSGSLMFSL